MEKKVLSSWQNSGVCIGERGQGAPEFWLAGPQVGPTFHAHMLSSVRRVVCVLLRLCCFDAVIIINTLNTAACKSVLLQSDESVGSLRFHEW